MTYNTSKLVDASVESYTQLIEQRGIVEATCKAQLAAHNRAAELGWHLAARRKKEDFEENMAVAMGIERALMQIELNRTIQ